MLLHYYDRFTSADPGVVFFKERPGDPELSARILDLRAPITRPPPLPSPGLDLKRQKYLYTKIRPFVPEEHQDTLCPLPEGEVTPSPQPSPPPSPPPPPQPEAAAPKKSQEIKLHWHQEEEEKHQKLICSAICLKATLPR
jgi:hypothetical protein